MLMITRRGDQSRLAKFACAFWGFKIIIKYLLPNATSATMMNTETKSSKLLEKLAPKAPNFMPTTLFASAAFLGLLSVFVLVCTAIAGTTQHINGRDIEGYQQVGLIFFGLLVGCSILTWLIWVGRLDISSRSALIDEGDDYPALVGFLLTDERSVLTSAVVFLVGIALTTVLSEQQQSFYFAVCAVLYALNLQVNSAHPRTVPWVTGLFYLATGPLMLCSDRFYWFMHGFPAV